VTPWTSLLARLRAEPGRASLEVTADWLQGRTVFGGLQAAVALRAMRTLVPEVPLRTLQGTFLAPVPEGTLTATARVLRTGKSATHVEARIVDGDTSGLQWSFVNLTRGDLYGLQVGGFNQTDTGRGVQLGAVNHVQSDFRGLEIGLVNYANRISGVQIGLINIIAEGGQFPIFPIVNWGSG